MNRFPSPMQGVGHDQRPSSSHRILSVSNVDGSVHISIIASPGCKVFLCAQDLSACDCNAIELMHQSCRNSCMQTHTDTALLRPAWIQGKGDSPGWIHGGRPARPAPPQTHRSTGAPPGGSASWAGKSRGLQGAARPYISILTSACRQLTQSLTESDASLKHFKENLFSSSPFPVKRPVCCHRLATVL